LVFVYNDWRSEHVNILNNAHCALFGKLSQTREYDTAAKRKSNQSDGPHTEIAVDQRIRQDESGEIRSSLRHRPGVIYDVGKLGKNEWKLE